MKIMLIQLTQIIRLIMEKAIKEMRVSELRALQDESDEMIIEGYAAVFNCKKRKSGCGFNVSIRGFLRNFF